MSTINTTQMHVVLAGIIGPITGRMMTKDEVALHRVSVQVVQVFKGDSNGESQ